MASTLFISSAWKLSRIAEPFCVPCCRARYSTALLCKSIQQEVDFEERDNSLERKTEATKLVMKESRYSSSEGETSSKKSKAKRKIVKGKRDRGAPVGDVSEIECEQASISAKSKSSKSTPTVTKTNRKGFVIFPAGTSLPRPSEFQTTTLTQDTDRTAPQSGDVDSTQDKTISENQCLPVEAEKVYSNTSSVLGISSHDKDRYMQLFLKAGFSESDARFVLPYFPFCLKIDFRIAHRVVSLLEKHKLDWKLLLKWNAVCFAVQPEHVRCYLPSGSRFLKRCAIAELGGVDGFKTGWAL